MSIDVLPATEDEKPVVRRLLELNSHDFSEFDGRDLGPTGEYGYRYLDHYWIEQEDRHAFIVRVDGAIAGCVLVRAGSPHRFGEFFIVRKHRRSGVGTKVARAVFDRFPGAWLVEEISGNDAAVAFWRRAIPVDFEEAETSSGTSQRFVSRAH
ncbi:Predicted acetyltransferase [Blastococcus aggregatus]|uniref:Predicted acetyltransferase n=1 Tax=Blastococcus aggregatus TaxID=38502 RepID=A0A285VA77_9ACTN|nr:GNAT family N-acetyltransferase [Blastococcus aggregatus]SOC50979.1 Predicted acetyltransferase [Blastococcus aggregatus]